MARKTPQAVPTETPVIGEWEKVILRCKEVGEEKRIWAMVFKCGGVRFGLFQANFDIKPVPDKSYVTQYTGITRGRWSALHVDSGRMIYHNCQTTPQEALLFFTHFRTLNFGKGKENKKRFGEAVVALNEKLTKEGR
jgi:hypothetical protein